ncbi:MAG: adenosylcobinamide amidohydrolase [Rhodospirillales bacterium]|nr:adenosylcobinamide amidohydrolase [Rhodospirillales bacterium]
MSFDIIHEQPWLIARFPKPQRMLSWSLTNPGYVEADQVAWMQVQENELSVDLDPVNFFSERLIDKGLGGAIGLMTSTPLENYCQASAEVEGVNASCLITLGLSNALHVGAGEFPKTSKKVGTINLLCSVSQPLTQAAQLEALSVATQARTAGVLEAGYCHPGEGKAVSGTGTDCIVIACPNTPQGQTFAGLHTPVGKAVGSVVYKATQQATANWLKLHAP